MTCLKLSELRPETETSPPFPDFTSVDSFTSYYDPGEEDHIMVFMVITFNRDSYILAGHTAAQLKDGFFMAFLNHLCGLQLSSW